MTAEFLGQTCFLEGCKMSCHGHGGCVRDDRKQMWGCECEEGWGGRYCAVRLETNCQDGVDDDQGK